MDQVSEFRLSYLATSFTATGSLENSQALCIFLFVFWWEFSGFELLNHMNLLGQEEETNPTSEVQEWCAFSVSSCPFVGSLANPTDRMFVLFFFGCNL